MKKALTLRLSLLLALSISFAGLKAEQRSYSDAAAIAGKLLGNATLLNSEAKAPAFGTTEASRFVPYYIFNKEDGQGFAVVSGSDYMRPVIGYNTTGTVSSEEELPDNIQSWLDFIAEAAEFLELHPEYALTSAQKSATYTPIQPILKRIQWDQSSPFNDQCPSVNGSACPVGCVATAAAQCLYFWKYPSAGTGSHTYTFDLKGTSTTLTVNFAKQTYDYSLMFDSVDNYISTRQKAEVAKLSYHLGVATNMEYDPSGSGANYLEMRDGLVGYFGYDELSHVLLRALYSYDEWNEVLIHELNNGRPVMFAGSDESDGGHAFVLDGIDEEGLYHVNWGWGGRYNGYFDVTVLNAEGAGTGANLNQDGFSYSQNMLVNLAPKDQVKNGRFYTTLCGIDGGSFGISESSARLGSKITLTTSKSVYNYSANDQIGSVGIAFVQDGQVKYNSIVLYTDEEGTFTFTFPEEDPFPGWSDEGVYGFKFPEGVSAIVPENLADGSYKVYLSFQPLSGAYADSVALIHFLAGERSYWNCQVSNGTATFSKEDISASLAVSDCNYANATISQGESKQLSCKIKNQSGETFVGKLSLLLTSPDNKKTRLKSQKSVKLAAGEETTVTFPSQSFTYAGTWKAALYYYLTNIDDDPDEDLTLVANSSTTFLVDGENQEVDIALAATPTVASNNSYGDSLFIGYYAQFKLKIKNNGGAFNGNIKIQIMKNAYASSPTGVVICPASIAAGTTEEYIVGGTLTQFASSFPTSASGTKYVFKAYYEANGSYTAIPTTLGAKNQGTAYVYSGNPATGLETITSDAEANKTFYNLQGQQVSGSTDNGIYITKGRKLLVK